MRFQKLMTAALAAAAFGVVLFMGCGEEGGGGRTACTTDASCMTGELCHPTAKVCVKTCDAGADCPREEPTCDTMTGASGKFCQCSTTALCAGGADPAAICSSSDKICEAKCTADTDCGGRTCNTTTGVCEESTGTLGKSCSTATTQPDICDNGQFCSGTTPVCTAVPAPTCMNFTGGSHSTTPWTATNVAPVIYDVSKVSFQTDTTFCGTGTNTKRVKVHVKAYSKSGQFATGSGIESQVHYVRSDGTEGPTTSTTQAVTVSTDKKNAEFDMNFCVAGTLTQFTGGLHFYVNSVTGNLYCFVIQ
jgi:hypothetical protein